MKRRVRLAVLLVVAAVLVALGVAKFFFTDSGPGDLSLGQLERRLDAGQVVEAEMLERDSAVVVELDDGERYRVAFPAEYGDELTGQLLDAGLDLPVDAQHRPLWVGILAQLLPFVLVAGLVVFVLLQLRGGARGFGLGRSRARPVDRPDVKFDDVAGLNEAVEELREIRDFLADPTRFTEMGAAIPKGVLLVGPPGTGKTLLARAVAGEAGVPFLSISGSDFVEMFVGVGASRVRDLFEQAKGLAPSIVFIDEIDAVGRQRGAGVGGGHDEREQTLNQLLVEMDGFDHRQGVILIAATNRPDILDPALLRPGRFDRQVIVDRPDVEGRKAILEVHAKGKPLAPGVDLSVVARRTPGFTGADLGNLLNEAALLAARRGHESIGHSLLEEAIDRVIAGPEHRSRLISDREKRVIAYHEAGHALVGHALPNADPVHKISIIPRGRALGYTLTLPAEDRYLSRRSELADELAMLLGGRTAEEMVFADPTTGAQNDIEKATRIARQMVTQWGMSDALGPVQLGQHNGEVFLGRDLAATPDYSDAVAARIDAEIRALLDAAHHTARTVLSTHRDVLDALADALIERETLETEEVMDILGAVPAWSQDEAGGSGRPSVAAADPGE
ncbi:MAG TPA: ATP-dependent zinc metalloprotease FtsH [Acidimicrobiia bacterium]|nr:ATP-dependent zinc metalloprotease FtsH [Acidimicrobiia bacterium]